jgi:hypothetical protein
MTHNRKSCIALFLEAKYETLTVETYWESRVMFNQCKVYKGTVTLKMYPTWEKNNPGKLHMIAKKYRKVYQSSIDCKPSAPLKRKATYHIELPPPKHRNLVVKAIPNLLSHHPVVNQSGGRRLSFYA